MAFFHTFLPTETNPVANPRQETLGSMPVDFADPSMPNPSLSPAANRVSQQKTRGENLENFPVEDLRNLKFQCGSLRPNDPSGWKKNRVLESVILGYCGSLIQHQHHRSCLILRFFSPTMHRLQRKLIFPSTTHC